jgi:hypothetical protein
MTGVMIFELIRNNAVTGSPIATKVGILVVIKGADWSSLRSIIWSVSQWTEGAN